MDSVGKEFAYDKRMEKPKIFADLVDIDQLVPWAKSATNWESDIIAKNPLSAFPMCEDFNEKVALWTGDITLLNASAIVNIMNDGIQEHGHVTKRLIELAGPSSGREILSEVKMCRVGEAVITSGYGLPSRFVIHATAPKFSDKYKSAAENALTTCYRQVFELALQNNISSVAIPPVHSYQRGYPADEGADVTGRFLRQFLENHGDKVKKVILVLNPTEKVTFDMILPLYLPRNAAEEAYSAENVQRIPKIGNGFAAASERLIRITDNPQHNFEAEDLVDDENNLGISVNVGRHAFSQMEDNFDRQRLLDPGQRLVHDDLTEEIQRRERYDRLLRQSKIENLSDMSGIGCLYQSGYDKAGRPVIICVGKWMNYEELDLEKMLLYLINMLEPIVKGDYVVIYFHTQTAAQNHPPMNWMKDVYSTLQYKHKKNLKAFYIVHPTFWTRVMTWWFLTFMAPAIKQKVVPVYGLEYLHEFIDPDELNIPTFITEHDIRTNGIHYHHVS